MKRKPDFLRDQGGGLATLNNSKRSRCAEDYRVESDPIDARSAESPRTEKHGSAPVIDLDEAPPPDSARNKRLYLETVQKLLREVLQSNWGRVQQREEMEYEALVELAASLRKLESSGAKPRGKILEEFEGFLEKYDGNVAYVTLTTDAGETIHGEYPAPELKAEGVRERRRFKCWTVEAGSDVKFVVHPIPDVIVSEAEERQLDEWLRESLGDDPKQGN